MMNYGIYFNICQENAVICSEQMTGQLILCEAGGDERLHEDAVILFLAPMLQKLAVQ